jgi:hypothetical protein
MFVGKLKSIAFSLGTGGLLLIGLLLLLNEAPQKARAEPGTWFVVPSGAGDCSQGDPCSLQAALSAANDGDAIYMGQGTYTGAGAAVITITEDITLYGGWDGAPSGAPHRDPVLYPATLDGQNARRVVYISGPAAPVLDGLVITAGEAEGLGGDGSSDAGGGIYGAYANPLINDCTIIDNSAGPASAAHEGTGGGLFLRGGDARLENSRIISNTARWGGGARLIAGEPVLRHNLFLSNTSLFGGGVYLMAGRGVVEDNRFQGNTGDRGGAIYLSTASSAVKRNLIRGNSGRYGGGIGINGGSPFVSGNRILENLASHGGAVNIEYSESRLENNFIADNEAAEGAGVRVRKGPVVLRHNTLASNTGADGVGVLVETDASVVLTNTILVSHTVGIRVTAGSTATLEATLWYDNGLDTGGAGAISTGTLNVYEDPAFVDPVAWDYHLTEGSPAIDAGVYAGVTTDIDGEPRGISPDIGADEYITTYSTWLPLVLRLSEGLVLGSQGP